MLVTLGALALGGAAAVVIMSATQRSSTSVERLSVAIEPPMDHLLRTERANGQGQEALHGAVSSTGSERTRLLSASIVASQEASAAWTEYRASALDLPGEDELADRYEADQREVQQLSSELLVPILNSETSGTLPSAQVEAHQAADNDLRELYTLYRASGRAELDRLESDIARSSERAEMVTLAALVLLLLVASVSMRRAQRVHRERMSRRAAQRLVAFEGRLRRALELVDSESSVYRVAERGMTEMAPSSRVSVLVADASRAALRSVAREPVCGVTSPSDCPALRTTSVVTITDSASLDACPMLAEHAAERCSATCLPITVGGRSGALIQAVGPTGHPPDGNGAAAIVARGVGDRVTLIQALETFQLQASRDPLTGLLNRRSLMAEVDELLGRRTPFALAFCDLDHFKELNDLHGHDAGDRALRSFAETLTESLRPQDIICRWGGEEFLIVLPDCDAPAAVEAMDRVRTNLLLGSMSTEAAMFTASFGIAVSSAGETFDEVVALADAALREAKETGRDRVVSFDAARRDPDAADHERESHPST